MCKDSLNRRGLSLVELIITMTILLIVLAVGYPFYHFGTRTASVGEDQSNIQRDIRLNGDFITKELRNATEIEIVPSASEGSGDTDNQYFYLENNNIMHKTNANPTNPSTFTNRNILSLTFTLQQTAAGNNFVTFIVSGQEGTQTYSVESQVHLNNLTGLPAATGTVIRYKR
ncbi:MAG TPA: prepilin-type N-terminal cleavage/methylation domain-containing protein [Oscillospiraceae bacterium]|nr:prepilin-type N-terminal cleavage/methylation domain-containing protein [Oscillospiraceae bacterium]